SYWKMSSEMYARSGHIDNLLRFFLKYYGDHRDLHSFPTRQSGSPLFQRQMTTGLSRWAKRTELVMLTVQVAIVVFAMTLTLQLLWGQWQQQQLQHVTGDIQVTRVAKFGAPVSVKALQQNLPSSLPADAVAFANSWFEQPTTVVLEDAGKQLTQS